MEFTCKERNGTSFSKNLEKAKGKVRKDVHLGSNLPSDLWIAMSDNKSLNTTHQVHFIKNILISNIRSFSEVFKPMLPPDSTIIKQCIPHTLCVFSTSQDVLCKIKSFCWHQMIHGRKLLKKNEIVLKDFNEGLIKEVLHH